MQWYGSGNWGLKYPKRLNLNPFDSICLFGGYLWGAPPPCHTTVHCAVLVLCAGSEEWICVTAPLRLFCSFPLLSSQHPHLLPCYLLFWLLVNFMFCLLLLLHSSLFSHTSIPCSFQYQKSLPSLLIIFKSPFCPPLPPLIFSDFSSSTCTWERWRSLLHSQHSAPLRERSCSLQWGGGGLQGGGFEYNQVQESTPPELKIGCSTDKTKEIVQNRQFISSCFFEWILSKSPWESLQTPKAVSRLG